MTTNPSGPDMSGHHHAAKADSAVPPEVAGAEDIDRASVRDDLEQGPEEKRNQEQTSVSEEAP